MTVVCLHGLGRTAADWDGVRAPRALVLTSCFFPPARNGRSLGATLADYGRHRVAFVRAARRGPSGGSARALASLARLAAQPGRLTSDLDAVLVIHARDDHHVPIDFALAAAGREGWAVEELEHGDHHPHVDTPQRWLAAAVPWLQRTP